MDGAGEKKKGEERWAIGPFSCTSDSMHTSGASATQNTVQLLRLRITRNNLIVELEMGISVVFETEQMAAIRCMNFWFCSVYCRCLLLLSACVRMENSIYRIVL